MQQDEFGLFENEVEAKKVAQITFDGGCQPNPGMKYGSYEVRLDGRVIAEANRLQLGFGTNNEAEFDALILALSALLSYASTNQIPHNDVRISIKTDSMIVRNWLLRFEKKSRKVKNERMGAMCDLACKCVEHLKRFSSFTAEWNSRDHNVALFGH